MWEEVIKLAVGNGLWAVLGVLLLVYLLKDSKKRETKYTETISALVEKMRTLGDLKADTERILQFLSKQSVFAAREGTSRGKKEKARAEGGSVGGGQKSGESAV